jgi:hypothetical protein
MGVLGLTGPSFSGPLEFAVCANRAGFEDDVDFSVSINTVRTFGHPLKRENHLESELDPQLQT